MTRFVLSLALALLLAPSASDAAFTSDKCLAAKRQAWGNLRKCQTAQYAKTLEGKTPDLAKCQTKFDDKLAKLTEKASDATVECRYRDNGDQTVTDYDKGLQWEKKASPGGGTGDVHDVDHGYTWSISGTNPTGFVSFLHQLNSCTVPSGIGFSEAGFAFQCDWRLPTVGELLGILLQPTEPCADPCIDPIFGGTASTCSWSSSTLAGDHDFAWCVDFGVVGSSFRIKTSAARVRAVRNAGF